MAHAKDRHRFALLVRSIEHLVSTVVRASILMHRPVTLGKLADSMRIGIAAYRIKETLEVIEKGVGVFLVSTVSPLYEYTLPQLSSRSLAASSVISQRHILIAPCAAAPDGKPFICRQHAQLTPPPPVPPSQGSIERSCTPAREPTRSIRRNRPSPTGGGRSV